MERRSIYDRWAVNSFSRQPPAPLLVINDDGTPTPESVKLRDAWIKDHPEYTYPTTAELLRRSNERRAARKSLDTTSLDDRIRSMQQRLDPSAPPPDEYPIEEGACPPHQWDRAGERCLKCGDKDWM